EISSELEGCVAGLEPGVLSAGLAAEATASFARIERLAVAGKALCAARVAETELWKASGARSAAGGVGQQTRTRTPGAGRGPGPPPGGRQGFVGLGGGGGRESFRPPGRRRGGRPRGPPRPGGAIFGGRPQPCRCATGATSPAAPATPHHPRRTTRPA